MDVIIQNSKIIKPVYEGIPPSNEGYIPFSVFDKVTYNVHVAVIYAYRPPTATNKALEVGLQKVLAEYREWAGRLGEDEKGDPIILLNDEGVKYVEAYVDSKLDDFKPLKPSRELLCLHPGLKGVKELVQVQLTRFSCGSLVVGFTAQHLVADGHSTSNFLVAWGKATRGLEITPRPLHDRAMFVPRDPPKFEFEHRGVEYKTRNQAEDVSSIVNRDAKEIVMHQVHYTKDFLSQLKAKASSSLSDGEKPYSTFESLSAHLWRVITRARAIKDSETTYIRIAVNGRMRLNPRIPNEYFGNLVLWAFPTSKVEDLLQKPVSYAANLIHEAVLKVNNNYFRSFIDFASLKAKEEGLLPTANPDRSTFYPNMQVDSWLHFPFYDLDFGCGTPFIFLPSYVPIEGLVFLSPSFSGDGSIDAYVPLFENNLASFQEICNSVA